MGASSGAIVLSFSSHPRAEEVLLARVTRLAHDEVGGLKHITRHEGFKFLATDRGRREGLSICMAVEAGASLEWFKSLCVYYKTPSYLYLSTVQDVRRNGDTDHFILICTGFIRVMVSEETPPNLQVGVNIATASGNSCAPKALIAPGHTPFPTLP